MTRCITMKARMSKPLAIRVHPEFSVPLNRMIDEIEHSALRDRSKL